MGELKQFPSNWLIGQDYDPNQHFFQIVRFDKKTQKNVSTDYLNVQNRLIWFIRDQRMLIAQDFAKTTYVILTELIELDREKGWAHFRTYVRDVLGNEATMYGSESIVDFNDYIEKASTKSLGRALLLLGYGTAFADELDEGERPVDAPVTRPAQPTPIRTAAPVTEEVTEKQYPMQRPPVAPSARGTGATDKQKFGIRNLCRSLKRAEPEDLDAISFADASELMGVLSAAMDAKRNGTAPVEETPPLNPAQILNKFMSDNKVSELPIHLYCARPQHNIKRHTIEGQAQLAADLQTPEATAEIKLLQWAHQKPFKIADIDTFMQQESIATYVEFFQIFKAASPDDQSLIIEALTTLARP